MKTRLLSNVGVAELTVDQMAPFIANFPRFSLTSANFSSLFCVGGRFEGGVVMRGIQFRLEYYNL